MYLPPERLLVTPRLTLRPIQPRDEELLWPVVADPHVSALMAWQPHADLAQTRALVAHEVARSESGQGASWIVLRGAAFCGLFSLIALRRTHRALTFDSAELAYWAAPAMQRQGIMTEAGQAVLGFAFGPARLHKLHVSHFGGNQASRALILRLGFRHVGIQRQEFRKEGVWHDHWLYELLADEAAAQPRTGTP